MLSESDADIARRSPSLPGVAVLLDDEAFRERLQASLPGSALQRTTRRYVRLKPGTNLLVAYDGSSSAGPVALHAKAHRADAPEKMEKAGERRGAAGRLGAGRLVWPDLAVEVCLFPNDNKLRVLGRLDDPASRSRLFHELFGDGRDPREAVLEPLSYKPERRFVARLVTPGHLPVVLKAYDEGGFSAAQQVCAAVRDTGLLAVPSLVGQSARRRVLALGWLEGAALVDALPGPHGSQAAWQTGAALASFHRGTGVRLPMRHRDGEARHVLAVAQGVAFLRPAWEARVRDLGFRIAAALAALPEFAEPIHGDFHPKQAVLGRDRVGLVDFDEATLGDPAWDLGNFCAHLDVEALVGRLDPGRLGPLREAFLEGAGAGRECRRRSHLGHAAGLFRLAPHFFRTGRPGWEGPTGLCLDAVASLLATASGHAPRPVARPCPASRPVGVASLPESLGEDVAFAGLGGLFDPGSMTGHLRRLPEGWAHDCRVEGIRLLRHKPGRRALLEYTLAWPPAPARGWGVTPPPGDPSRPVRLLGKVKARGLDRLAAPLLTALREAGFGDGSEDGISVPEPLGQIAALHVWFQRLVPGVPVSIHLGAPDGPELCGRAAEALVKLHQARVRPRREHRLADEREILATRLGRLAAARPTLEARLTRLLEACDRLLARLPFHEPRGLHRDFYPDQLLWNGERIYLLDLDLHAAGHPDLDAGNFLGHLEEGSLRHPEYRHGMAGCEGAFLESYLRRSVGSRLAGVESFRTLTLVRHVQLCTQFPARAHLLEELLDRCERRLDVGQPAAFSPAIPSQSPAPFPAPP